MIERIKQRIRYFPWWVWHPAEYSRSEKLRRATNLVAQVLIDSEMDGSEVGMPNEQEGWSMYARIQRWQR